jgi:hypothetical protein
MVKQPANIADNEIKTIDIQFIAVFIIDSYFLASCKRPSQTSIVFFIRAIR